MTKSQLNALVKKHGGWWEKGNEERVARFPTPYNKEQFLTELKTLESKE
jgi:hypothetical protein